MGNGLFHRLEKWLPWAKRDRLPPIDLNVTDQLALSFLLRFERGTVDIIFAEVNTVRPLVSRAELLMSLTRLTEIGLLERASPLGGPPGERVYQISKLGKSLKGIIPVEPKSVLSVRI